MKNIFVIVWILTVHVAAADAKLTSVEVRIKEATDQCMLRVSNGQADDAFNSLFKEFWSDRATAAQATTTMQRQYRSVLGRLEDNAGKAVPGGYEFIGLKRLGTSVLKLVYIQKNELSFLPWAFSFYRSNQDWRLTHIAFPDIGSEEVRDFTAIVFAGE